MCVFDVGLQKYLIFPDPSVENHYFGEDEDAQQQQHQQQEERHQMEEEERDEADDFDNNADRFPDDNKHNKAAADLADADN
jgi:hypothetical protein